MADIVTDGRVIMGVGRGYHSREVETFGAPVHRPGRQPRAVRGAGRPAAEVLQRGVVQPPRQALRLPAPRGVPRLPAHRDHLRAAAEAPARSRSGCRSRAASRSTTWRRRTSRRWSRSTGRRSSTTSSWPTADACAKYGRPKQLGEDVIWGAGLYLADTPEEAKRRVEPSHDERYKWFAPFGFVRYADEQGRTWGTPGAPARVPSLADGIQQKAWFCGPPAHVIDGIRSIEAQVSGPRGLHDPLGRGHPARASSRSSSAGSRGT